MSTQTPARPRLLLFDVTTGPRPQFYLPRLCAHFELHIMWIPSGNRAKDDARAVEFEQWCTHTTMRGQESAVSELVEYGRAWRAEGVLGFGEMAMEVMHEAALELGLPSNEPWAVKAIRDKHEQRRLLAKAGVPTPRFMAVHTFAELEAAVKHVGLPAMLKPKAGVGSLATFRVDEHTDLAALWEEAYRSYRTDPRGGDSPEFLLEEFLVALSPHQDERYGAYASVESLVQNGVITHLAVTDKYPFTAAFRENGGIMPSCLPRDTVDELYACAGDAIAALGFTNTGVHTEIMFTADGPRIIEVNSRIGGGVTEMLHYCSDYDSVLARAAIAVGRPVPEFTRPQRSTAYFVLQAPAFDSVLTKVPTAEELLETPTMVEAELCYASGDRPRWRQGTPGGTVARLVAVADGPVPLLDLFDDLLSDHWFNYEPVAERPGT